MTEYSGPNVTASPLDVTTLTAADIAVLSASLHAAARSAEHRQAAAEAIVATLFASLKDASGEPACVLTRCFQTCSYARLPLQYRDAADDLLERTPSHANMRCLALLATRGVRTVWNDVATSTNHQCIPLPSVEVVRRAPMVAGLLQQIGFSVDQVVTSPSDFDHVLHKPRTDSTNSSIFHVENAVESPLIPAQNEFVKPFKVRSVIGFGDILPDGEIFAVLLFLRTPVSAPIASAFNHLAASATAILQRFPPRQTFQPLNCP